MANAKRRCTYCKKYSEADKGIVAPIGFFCNSTCRYDYATKKPKDLKKKTIKRVETAFKAKKKKFKDNDLSHQKELTQTVFNKLRVLEEKLWFTSRGLEPQCISCGKKNMDFCCGHFKSRGSQANLSYDKKNTYLQCNMYCNSSLAANINGTKTTRGYIQGLIDRFGQDEANDIIEYCTNSTQVKKWTCEELIKMRKEFNAEIRKLTRG